MRRALILTGLGLSGVLMSACGEETPERAIYAVAHDLEHDGYESACERLYPGSRLSPAVRRALGFEQGPTWAPGGASCRRAFESGSLAEYTLVEPRVRSVSTRPLRGSGAVTAVATAQVAIDGERPVSVRLVELDGRWRVVPSSG